jgi:hypothetical protein
MKLSKIPSSLIFTSQSSNRRIGFGSWESSKKTASRRRKKHHFRGKPPLLAPLQGQTDFSSFHNRGDLLDLSRRLPGKIWLKRWFLSTQNWLNFVKLSQFGHVGWKNWCKIVQSNWKKESRVTLTRYNSESDMHGMEKGSTYTLPSLSKETKVRVVQLRGFINHRGVRDKVKKI